jgi:O-antigen/teichoic acid export membrane protein
VSAFSRMLGSAREQGFLHVFSTNVLLQLLGFGSVLIVAKLLLPAELALVRTAQAYAAVLVILAGAGVTAPLLRYAADRSINDTNKEALLATSLRWALASGLGVIAICLPVIAWHAGLLSSAGSTYALYALCLPALALTSVLFVYLQARQRFVELARNQALIKLVSLLLVIAATAAAGLKGFLLMTLATAWLGLIPLMRVALPRMNICQPSFRLPFDFRSLALYSVCGMLVTALGQSSDFILLDAFNVDRNEVGKYSLASVFLLAAMTLTGSVQAVLTPRFTALLSDETQFRAMLNTWMRRMVGLSVAAALLTWIGAWILESLVFGEKYSGYSNYLALLLLRFVFWSCYAIAGAALAAAGIGRSGMLLAVVVTAVAFAAGYPLVRLYGPWGAALAQALTGLVGLLLALEVQRREFKTFFALRTADEN